MKFHTDIQLCESRKSKSRSIIRYTGKLVTLNVTADPLTANHKR